MDPRKLWSFGSQLASRVSSDHVMDWSAAVGFYTISSLSPLLMISIAIAGFFFGQEAAQGHVVTELGSIMGSQGADAIQELLKNAQAKPKTGTAASIIGFGVLLFAASGVFLALESALNEIFKVPADKLSGFRSTVIGRLASFGVVLGLGFLILASLIFNTVVTGLSEAYGGVLPFTEVIVQVIHFVVLTLLVGVAFAGLLKYLTRASVPWKDALRGGMISSLLFNFGKFLIAMYLAKAGAVSTYGAAASLVLVMLWIYYSAIIFFVGAEITAMFTEARKPVKAEVQAPGEKSEQLGTAKAVPAA